MKARTLILVVLIMAMLLIAGICVADSKSFKRDFKKDMVGTWVNSNYNKNKWVTSKVVIKSDKTAEFYKSESDTWPSPRTIAIVDRWTDSEGNIYYKAEVATSIRTKYELWKLNNSKTTLELMSREVEYFTEIDPNNTYYRIYYRQ
jgi:hypothetical protein